jgi:predicted Zn-dependent peptidase
MTVVVTGDFDTSAVEKVVADQFGSWKRSTMLPDDGDAKRSAYEELLPGQSPIKESVSQKESDESYMVMAFNAPSVTDTPDAWEMDVLLTLLGQGGNNRLNSELKLKQHLVNTISADYLTQKDEGVLTVSVSMPTSNVDAVQTGVLNQISLLRDTPVSDAEVQSAINSLKASYLFDVDTDSGHADSLGFYDSIDSYMYDVNYLSRISVVTPADVQRIAQKYLDPNSYTVVMQIPPADASTAKDSSAKSSHLIAEGMVGSR